YRRHLGRYRTLLLHSFQTRYLASSTYSFLRRRSGFYLLARSLDRIHFQLLSYGSTVWEVGDPNTEYISRTCRLRRRPCLSRQNRISTLTGRECGQPHYGFRKVDDLGSRYKDVYGSSISWMGVCVRRKATHFRLLPEFDICSSTPT